MDQQIDENLKRVYNNAIEQEIPDRFKDLIAQLKQQRSGTAQGNDDT